jgi:7-cyano-7-deazaguanine synthase
LATVILLSGGLDSAVLLASEAARDTVLPIYVEVGLAWEPAERQMLALLLAAPVFQRNVRALETLTFDMRDVYPPTHWAITSTPPAYDTPDEDVYLAGRNLVLLTKAGVVAAKRRASRIALGPLAGNPFPDATPEFFAAMARALSLGLASEIAVATPFADLHKEDVIRLGASLGVPLELTLSCMNPQMGEPPEGRIPVHCGLCSKCRERRDGFAAARIDDVTTYAQASPR